MNGIKEIYAAWSLILAWCKQQGKGEVELLEKALSGKPKLGAGDALEEKLNVKLPTDFKASYAMMHETLRIQGYTFLKAAQIEKHLGDMNMLNATGEFKIPQEQMPGSSRIQPVWWHEKWIPIIYDEKDDGYLCVDMAPGPDGVTGQVIMHYPGEGPTYGFNSVFEYLRDFPEYMDQQEADFMDSLVMDEETGELLEPPKDEKKESLIAAEIALREKLKKEFKKAERKKTATPKPGRLPGNDLAVIRAAFKKMNKDKVIALCNVGPTQSGGWEDVADAAHERGLAEDEYTSIFWHNQSHDAFDKEGNLVSTLHLYWGGDRLLLAELLKEHLGAFHIIVPTTNHSAFTLRSVPREGTEIDVRDTPKALKILNNFYDLKYSPEEITVIRRMLRDSAPNVVFHAVFSLEQRLKLLNADDVATLLARLEELINFKTKKGYLNNWERLSCTIGYMLDGMARVKHPDYNILIVALARHKKADVREGVACHAVGAVDPSAQISILTGLLHDKELDVCITALYSLKDLYELTGRKQVDAYFDPMLNPDSGKQLLIGCAILLRNYSTYGAQARLEVHVRAYELAPQLRKLSTQFPKSPVPEKYEEHLTWLLAYPEGLNRVTHGNKVFDISVSNPISGENIEISTITSFGLSDISQEKAYDMEFCIEIAGKVSKDTIGEIGAAYGRLYDLVTGEKEVSTGKIYRSITLPAFANMNAVMITDRNSMEWLYRERKQGRVLMVIPLFENEADELEKLAFDQRYNLLRQLQIPINDPERKSAEASLRISKIALDE